jgi:hypothetical protein
VPFVFSIFISCRANLKHGSFTFMGLGSADAFTAGYTQSELMVANKGFMSEQEKDNQVAVSSLFTAYLQNHPLQEYRLYFLFLCLVVQI